MESHWDRLPVHLQQMIMDAAPAFDLDRIQAELRREHGVCLVTEGFVKCTDARFHEAHIDPSIVREYLEEMPEFWLKGTKTKLYGGWTPRREHQQMREIRKLWAAHGNYNAVPIHDFSRDPPQGHMFAALLASGYEPKFDKWSSVIGWDAYPTREYYRAQDGTIKKKPKSRIQREDGNFW